MAALICGGDTSKEAAIWGSDVEMMEESSPSMKKAPAITSGTISGSFAWLCSLFLASKSSDQ